MSGEGLQPVPQRSAVGHIIIYFNDFEERVSNKILTFADDTKLVFRKYKGNREKQQLQDGIDKLIKWSEKLQIIYSILSNVNAYTEGWCR